MRPTQERIKSFTSFIKELKNKNEIKEITITLRKYKLNGSVSTILQREGIIKKKYRTYYWVYPGEINRDLSIKLLEIISAINIHRSKLQRKINDKIKDHYCKSITYKNKHDFARLNGFGNHSPVSKMIKHLGNGNYAYGRRLFEIKFKEFMTKKEFQLF